MPKYGHTYVPYVFEFPVYLPGSWLLNGENCKF